jgi:hypothetical protein
MARVCGGLLPAGTLRGVVPTDSTWLNTKQLVPLLLTAVEPELAALVGADSGGNACAAPPAAEAYIGQLHSSSWIPKVGATKWRP